VPLWVFGATAPREAYYGYYFRLAEFRSIAEEGAAFFLGLLSCHAVDGD